LVNVSKRIWDLNRKKSRKKGTLQPMIMRFNYEEKKESAGTTDDELSFLSPPSH